MSGFELKNSTMAKRRAINSATHPPKATYPSEIENWDHVYNKLLFCIKSGV